ISTNWSVSTNWLAYSSLALESVESLLDLFLGVGRSPGERKTRWTAVVAVQIHGVFQAGHAVLNGYELGSAQNTILPVHAGRKFARAVRLPDADSGVRRRIGKRQHRSRAANGQRRREYRRRAGQYLKARRDILDHLDALFQTPGAFLDPKNVGMMR